MIIIVSPDIHVDVYYTENFAKLLQEMYSKNCVRAYPFQWLKNRPCDVRWILLSNTSEGAR